MTPNCPLHKQLSTWVTERADESAYSNANFSKNDTNTVYGKEKEVAYNTARIVYNKLLRNRASHIKLRVRFGRSETMQPKTIYVKDVALSVKDKSYGGSVTNWLSEFQSM